MVPVHSAGTRLAPKNYNPSIQTVVANYLNGRISADSYHTTMIDNTAYQTGSTGENLIIQATCQNKMDLLSGFIPSLANIAFSAQTIMKCE